MKPLFTLPLERLTEVVGPMTSFARTLPPDVLKAELEQLRGMEGLAPSFMAAIYAAEAERRANPELQFDDELDAALERLERQTTAKDRHRVHEIGLQLSLAGGTDALRRAYRRMMRRGRPSSHHTRAKILEARWAGIGGHVA